MSPPAGAPGARFVRARPVQPRRHRRRPPATDFPQVPPGIEGSSAERPQPSSRASRMQCTAGGVARGHFTVQQRNFALARAGAPPLLPPVDGGLFGVRVRCPPIVAQVLLTCRCSSAAWRQYVTLLPVSVEAAAAGVCCVVTALPVTLSTLSVSTLSARCTCLIASVAVVK